MTEDNVANVDFHGNAAFVALLWAKTLRCEKAGYYIPAEWLQLFPVIAAFAFPSGCFLSYDKIAAYAGMRKEKVGETIIKLVNGNWLYSKKIKNRNRLFPSNTYSPGCDSDEWFMIGVELIKNGVWGALEQTRQVIYCILQAWTVHPALAASYVGFTGGDGSEFDHESVRDLEINGDSLYNYSFLPLSRFDREKILKSANNSRIACCEDKTLQRALKYFQDNGLMLYSEEFDEPGFFFPRKPGLAWEPLKERLKRIEVAQSNHKISYAAKRAKIAAIKRSQCGAVKSKFAKAQ